MYRLTARAIQMCSCVCSCFKILMTSSPSGSWSKSSSMTWKTRICMYVITVSISACMVLPVEKHIYADYMCIILFYCNSSVNPDTCITSECYKLETGNFVTCFKKTICVLMWQRLRNGLWACGQQLQRPPFPSMGSVWRRWGISNTSVFILIKTQKSSTRRIKLVFTV